MLLIVEQLKSNMLKQCDLIRVINLIFGFSKKAHELICKIGEGSPSGEVLPWGLVTKEVMGVGVVDVVAEVESSFKENISCELICYYLILVKEISSIHAQIKTKRKWQNPSLAKRTHTRK